MVFVKFLLLLLEAFGGSVLVGSILAGIINFMVEITYVFTGKLKQLEPVERLTLVRLMRKRNWVATVALVNIPAVPVFTGLIGDSFFSPKSLPHDGWGMPSASFIIVIVVVSSFIMMKRIQPVHTAYLYLSQRADTLRSVHHLDP
ncbi:MAG: hypothetical protein ACYDHM_01575 [Acidiferrobacterales bacterium]